MAEGSRKSRQGKTGRYYIRGETVPFEEDMVHEFKGHRNLAVEELPPWTQESKTEKASRKAASRTINAFLNTGKGGTVYLGIIDSGVIRGIQLTQYQKDHIVGSLDDLLSRYCPPVKSHRYKVKFVPVVDDEAQGEALLQQGNLDASSSSSYSERLRPHLFQSFNYCWCDKEAVARYNAGILPTDYIIEIQLKKWNAKDPRNDDGCGTMINLHPIHEDEEGNCYFRRQASVVKYTMTEIAQLTKQEAKEECLREIESLKQEIMALTNG